MDWIGTRELSLTPQSRDSSDGSSGLRLAYFSNEFPKDNLQDLVRRLHVHSKDRRYATLAQFIQEATLAIREEIHSLPAAISALVPPFESVFSFAEEATLRSGPLGASIDGVLLCAVQIATLICYYEGGSDDNFASACDDTCLAGLGIGLLATIAVSLSPTLKDIVAAGSAVTRLAFRLGIIVGEVSENLEAPTSPVEDGSAGESWAYVVPDVTVEEVQDELNVIHAAEKISQSSKVFISALSRTSVTISGPPARLKHLSRISDFFRDRRMIALPVFGGLCHAKHIYQDHHVDSIVEGKLSMFDAKAIPRIPIFSTNSGRPFAARDARELFKQVIHEILTCAIHWDNVVHGVIQYAKDMGISRCQILVFRTSLPIHDLLAAMDSESPRIDTSITELIPGVLQPNRRPAGPRGSAESKIAIVGMACRMPGGASDTEKFWELLEQGLDVHKTVPADRFDVNSHYDPEGQRMNTSLTPYGCFIDEPGLFDAPFFNMSPREAQQTDPMQRLALVTAYEALERAGHVADRTVSTHRNRTGTFYGQASDDYREVNSNQEISTYFITGGCRAFGPGRINYYFKFAGPSYSIDTACSSSLATIQTACTSLWNGDTDCAVAGGMNVLTNSDAFAGLSNGHFLSKTPNACKTWDSEADGYCRADGIGSIVMKRLADAEADNDNILGVIVGAGTNHSADAISITHPHAGAQGYLTRQIMRQAGIDPLDVSFVEMHGTGTQAGDMQEIRSVCDVFAPLTRRRTPQQPLHIGAVKANVGHGEAAAGITALLKVLMMFQKEAIPPHVGIKTSINSGFPTDLEKRQLRIPFGKTPWPRNKTSKRIAVVNNFSAAGGNSTIAIEEGPVREVTASDPRSFHLITVSAKSKVSLKGNIERLIAYLKKQPNTPLADLGYTTTARRSHYNYRVTAAGSSVSALEKQLTTSLETVETCKPLPSTGTPPIVFAFTGQGASHRSTNLQLFHENIEFRKQILHLNTLSMSQGFPSFLSVIDGSHSQDTVQSPVVTQLALVCTEIALARYWGSLGVRPDVVVGHSLGEYAALQVAGVLSASDAVSLVGRRALMLERNCHIGSHKMVAVRASLADIQKTAEGKLYEVACVNGPKDTVLSGTVAEMDAVTDVLQGAGYKCFSLDVAFAFHSSQTDPILAEFENFANGGILFQPPNLPVISPLLGKVVFGEKTIDASYMCRATRETVNFLSAIQTARRTETIDETMVWIEIGPHPVVTGFASSILANEIVSVPSMRRGEDNWQTMARSLGVLHSAGVALDWNEFHRPFEPALRLLDLPTYAWNDKNHWLQYNGDWNLTKGNTYYDAEKAALMLPPTSMTLAHSALETSTVQRIIEESFSEASGKVVMQSDLMQADFLTAAWGHQMNGCGVVTSSIHADIAYTLGKYLMERLKPKAKSIDMNIANLEVVKGLVARKNTKVPQIIQVSVSIDEASTNIADLTWHNVSSSGIVEEPFATANIIYGSSTDWLSSWIPMTHLVQGRIDSLERLANEGIANRLSHSMAYLLFANNLVDYATKYRGMQSVVMHELEAFADITLTSQSGGTWTIPPYFIDSVAHLAGFVMNVSDANDCKNNFCVTPGWTSLRFARPLVAGAKYRSYVKMIQTNEDPTIYLGDVYVMQECTIIGMCGGIKFRRYPRVLLDRFFSPPDAGGLAHTATKTVAASIKPTITTQQPVVSKTDHMTAALPDPKPEPAAKQTQMQLSLPAHIEAAPAASDSKSAAKVDDNPDSIVVKAMSLVADEAQLELTDLEDEASFENLGIDSLMSLVIAEKFRKQLGVVVNGSLFMEYPTVGDLRSWLIEYYS